MTMKNNNLKIEFCDFDKIEQHNAAERIAKAQCAICEKFACDTDCRGRARDYDTTQHLPKAGLWQNHPYPFICSDCWAKAHKASSDKITKGVDIRASGSSWAIRLGEYVTFLQQEKTQEINNAFIAEVKRLIKIK